MKNGIILKIISEYAHVLCDNKIYECKSIGKLKHNNIKPTTGDNVIFEIIEERLLKGVVVKILERKNELYRPRIVNIDQVVIITALREPVLNTYSLNKYLFFVEIIGIKPILAFTKVDLINGKEEDIIKAEAYRRLGYETYLINNMIDSDVEWMKFLNCLEKKVSVLTGQTGAGKSTTLNHIIPNLFEKTQEISKSLNRGKHTTTKNELFIYKNSLIGDTPGFSSFEYKEIDPHKIALSLRYFKNLNCKFKDCLHTLKTPGCQLIDDVRNNKFPEFIYNDYLKVQNEIEEKNKRRKY